MIASERETTVNIVDDDDLVYIWSARRKDITAMRRKAGLFTEVATNLIDETQCVSFTAPRAHFNIASAIRAPRELTDDQRGARRNQLASARKVASS